MLLGRACKLGSFLAFHSPCTFPVSTTVALVKLDGISLCHPSSVHLWTCFTQCPNYCIVVFGEQRFCTYLLLSWFCKHQPSPLWTKEPLSFHPFLEKVVASSPGSFRLPFSVFSHNSTTFFLRCGDKTAQGNEDVGTAVFSLSAKWHPFSCSRYPFWHAQHFVRFLWLLLYMNVRF